MPTALRHHLVLLAALALTAAVYWPGLAGGYLFDDAANFVDNPAVHVTSLDWRDWRAAALASPSTELRRPLAMLSFAANYYFTRTAPFPVKLVNLVIHLCNGLLLWLVLRRLLWFWQRMARHPVTDSTARLASTGITAAWLLAPINLSAVLYAVQRMESLAQLFVLAGLWVYLSGRRRMLTGERARGVLICALGLALGAGLGVLCKESAVLLPLYALLAELVLLRFETGSAAARRTLWTMYALLLLLPAAAGLAWLLPRVLSDGAYASRPFTLAERLYTEGRILVDYAAWTLFPEPNALSFYHDDITVSKGWLSPPATLAAVAGLAGLLALGFALRRSLPLFSLGIGWFFAAHLLTATLIPLELVFEHRNYFASIGLLLAAAALLLALPARWTLLPRFLPLVACAAFAAVTWLRATQWSDPILFAYVEARSHPLSPRANYELGRTLAVASGYRPDSRLIQPALEAFDHAGRLPGADASPWAAMIVVAGHTGRPIEAGWWAQLTQKLSAQPPSAEAISSLESLYECQHRGSCQGQTQQLLLAFLAALNHGLPSGRLLAAYGKFAANELGDYPLAERLFTDAAQQLPEVNGLRLDLAKVLMLEQDYERADQVLGSLQRDGMSEAEIKQAVELRQAIDAVRNVRKASVPPS